MGDKTMTEQPQQTTRDSIKGSLTKIIGSDNIKWGNTRRDNDKQSDITVILEIKKSASGKDDSLFLEIENRLETAGLKKAKEFTSEKIGNSGNSNHVFTFTLPETQDTADRLASAAVRLETADAIAANTQQALSGLGITPKETKRSRG